MEQILEFFVFNDTYVVAALVIVIAFIIVMLLVFNQKSPGSVIRAELGGEEVEGALRRVLREQQWVGAGGGTSEGEDGARLDELQKEVLEKDRAIAELNKQIVNSGGEGGSGGGDNGDLMARIAELEARLEEYEIIEDDIADLSLYKNENEKLKAELDRLKALAGKAESAPAEEVAPPPAPEPSSATEPDLPELVPSEEPVIKGTAVDGADLVAEFEKVVNNQDDMTEEAPISSAQVDLQESVDSGKVVVAEEKEIVQEPVKQDPPPVHHKLRNVSPDSKQEAEVFISELKLLKKQKGSN